MVSFRKEKKKHRMQERKAAEEARERRDPDAPPAEGICVTDRRRISLDEPEGNAATQGASAGEDAPNFKPTYVEQLEARTRAAEQKAAEVQARFEQVRAELRRETDEIRQRLNRAADERARRDKAAFAAALLPVMDNLQRAIEAAESGGTLEALLNGLRGTVSGFEMALAAAGLEPVPALGVPFDPELHEAVDLVGVEAERDNIVTSEYSRGYKMDGQLLRPARVQVGRARAEAHKAAE